ncbi:hypothetical protein [Paenibacillus sp. FSL L8-0158]|uniref:hypothetical protein n=1 Tax=Paenibacillus sp. FSL L8-0158 TaxID=2954752 RepID=UPI0031582915
MPHGNIRRTMVQILENIKGINRIVFDILKKMPLQQLGNLLIARQSGQKIERGYLCLITKIVNMADISSTIWSV